MIENRKRRPNRSAAEWAELIAAWRRSGLNGRAFAAEHDLGVGSLYGWAAKLARGGNGPGREERFVAVEIVGGRPPSPLAHATATMELVAHSGRVIRLAGAVDADALATVLEVAERC